MSDWVAPIILAVLAFLMSMGIKTLQGIIDDTKMMDDASSYQQRGGSGRSSSTSTRRNRPSSLNTTIHDNYISYEDPFMIKLQDEREWAECDKEDPRWWDGQSEPENMWEELSKRIWSSRPEFKDAVGFEYWCNILHVGKELPWHIDKDEDAMRDYDSLVTPLLGAVYYGFNHDKKYDGGKLWIVDAQWDDDPLEYESLRRHELREIDANYNRLIYFNASLWHRVSGVTSGARYTFAVNALENIPLRLNKD
jgi:hypothetical protein